MGYDGCATFCAVFSLLGIVLLTLFGRMFSDHAVSFAIMAVESGWDVQSKARACYNGAIIYTVVLLLSVVARVYFKRNDAAKRAVQRAQHLEEIQELLAGGGTRSSSVNSTASNTYRVRPTQA